jgi:hypothetical protein
VLRRPAVAAMLSLVMVGILILLSELKFRMVWMTIDFVDVMIIDPAAVRYLLTIFPWLSSYVALVGIPIAAISVLLWYRDPFRWRRRYALAGMSACLAGLVGHASLVAFDPHDVFYPYKHVSHFARSGVEAVSDFMTRGFLDSDPVATGRLKAMSEWTCQPAGKPPHIILVHDESAFDARALPGATVPPGYDRHFRSFDGKQRNFVAESAGGSSWFAEYNVLAGLSARSFGRFSYFVTRIAAGRVERGLPHSLRRCGYRTFSFYPALGMFMGARAFQKSVGIENFYDARALRASDIEPDRFYYDHAARLIGRERAAGPMFLFVYLSANHHPWSYPWRPDLTSPWKELGNKPEVEEYLRRQIVGMKDYQAFLQRLKRDYPDEQFLIVRYGDHQPEFAVDLLEPGIDDLTIAKRLIANDPRYYTTYYAIDAVNFKPVDLSSALDTIEAPYLPLIVQESAGIPLDPTFAEQKQILQRCRGLFYVCAGGAEARRFNRLLIDAGLIKGL